MVALCISKRTRQVQTTREARFLGVLESSLRTVRTRLRAARVHHLQGKQAADQINTPCTHKPHKMPASEGHLTAAPPGLHSL